MPVNRRLIEMKLSFSLVSTMLFVGIFGTFNDFIRTDLINFYDVIKNYCIPENDLPAKKYLYTLKFMLGQTACNDEKFDIALDEIVDFMYQNVFLTYHQVFLFLYLFLHMIQ